MREIELTQGYVALVDDEDYERVNEFKWHAVKHKNNKSPYACRKKSIKGKKTTILMHRFILGAKKGEYVDHIDRDGLNNQRSNIRICTQAQNCANRDMSTRGNTKYKGLRYFTMKDGKTYPYFYFCNHRLGVNLAVRVETEEDAARMYNEHAIKYYGEFANLNVID